MTMLRVILAMVILTVLYAVFGVLYRNKSCGGHCGGCSGTCRVTGEKYEDD
jgi:hypothetical protein